MKSMITELPDSAKVAVDGSPIDMELVQIQKELNGLSAAREQLMGKLGPAMLPDRRQEREDDDQDSPERSEIAHRLSMISERIVHETQELNQLLLRLEL